MVMAVVSPLALQLTAVAPVTETAEGPVIVKSLPLAAMELQRTGSEKFKVSEVGRHPGWVTVPIGIALCTATVNGTLLPAGTGVLQLSRMVLPSEPCAMLME